MSESTCLAHPYRSVPTPPPGTAAFDGGELRAAFLRPQRVIELLLVERARLARTVAEARHLATLVGLLVLTSVVGSQWAWYLRPFFGNRMVADDGSFCLGARPDFRGASSFYAAVVHLVRPPAPPAQP